MSIVHVTSADGSTDWITSRSIDYSTESTKLGRSLRNAIDQAAQDHVSAAFFALFANHERHGRFKRVQPKSFRLIQVEASIVPTPALIDVLARSHSARPAGLQHLIRLGALQPRLQMEIGSIVASAVEGRERVRAAMLRSSLRSPGDHQRNRVCEMTTISADVELPAGTWLLFAPK